MASREHIAELRKGADSWNKWRKARSHFRPDFAGAGLSGVNLYFNADLSHADFSMADLTSANLEGANLSHASLRHANLRDASLRKATLDEADLEGANLSGTNLRRVRADRARFRNADLSNTTLDLETCIDADFDGALIKDVSYDGMMNPMLTHFMNCSVINLIHSRGLDNLHPDSTDFLRQFIPDAFNFIHYLDLPATMVINKVNSLDEGHTPVAIGEPEVHLLEPYTCNRKVVDEMIMRLRLLQQVYAHDDNSNLVGAIRTVNAELVQYLRKHPTDLRMLNWRTFEELIAELLSNFGWSVELTRPTKDNGYDILGIHRDVSGISHTWIIECKCWAESQKVGIEVARALYTVKNELKVGGALLATTSDFTRGVKAFKASRYDFELRNYDGILEWLNSYRK